jgi:hypothetical protein
VAPRRECDEKQEFDDQGSAVMSSLRKFAPPMSRRIVAALASVALAGPALAAARHAPHASAPAPQSAGPAGSASVPAGEAKPPAGDTSRPVDAAAAMPAPKGPVDRGGKTTDSKSVGPIDLTRPDDGYNHDNLRRRAARASLIAAQKKPPAVPSATIGHPPASAAAERPRNATGVAVPAAPNVPVAVGAARPEPAHAEPIAATAFSSPKNNVGLSATAVHPIAVHAATTPAPPKPPVGGINGTSLHPTGLGIGGPAKDRSAIAGSSYRHK